MDFNHYLQTNPKPRDQKRRNIEEWWGDASGGQLSVPSDYCSLSRVKGEVIMMEGEVYMGWSGRKRLISGLAPATSFEGGDWPTDQLVGRVVDVNGKWRGGGDRCATTFFNWPMGLDFVGGGKGVREAICEFRAMNERRKEKEAGQKAGTFFCSHLTE